MFAISALLDGTEVVWNDELASEAEAEALVDEMFRADEANEAVIYELSDKQVWKSIKQYWMTAI